MICGAQTQVPINLDEEQTERKEGGKTCDERERQRGGGGVENMLRERRMLLKNEKDLKNTREGR